jgi:hypothetical protein
LRRIAARQFGYPHSLALSCCSGGGNSGALASDSHHGCDARERRRNNVEAGVFITT